MLNRTCVANYGYKTIYNSFFHRNYKTNNLLQPDKKTTNFEFKRANESKSFHNCTNPLVRHV